jgi:GntR family transcriptional regulator, transcriptional repressor for pyruvate dehydrogenase complex
MFQAAKKTFKISDQIIDQIRDAVLSGKLKPGDRLASEKELADQFNVSKATLREAMRVLEVMGLIEIRKGISGGIFIAEVDMRTTIHSIINFLHFQTISVKEITMLRYLIEPSVARIAAAKITDQDIENLTGILQESPAGAENEISREIGFHRYLARMTENPLLILIIDFVDNLLDSMKSKAGLEPDFYKTVNRRHQQIFEHLTKKNASGSALAMTTDILEVDRYLSRAMDSFPFNPAEINPGPVLKSGSGKNSLHLNNKNKEPKPKARAGKTG